MSKERIVETIEFVPPHAQNSRHQACLFIVEGSDAVIKMIINGTRPETTRLVSRTHRVVLDWLFDRCNLDAGIHIQFADTTRQIADVLTESFFAREQRDRQIAVFNVMDQTTFSCSHLRSLLMQLDESISKRQPQHEEEARSAETSRPVRNLCAERTSLTRFVFQVNCAYSVCSSWEKS